MIERILRIYRFEWTKAVRRWVTYLGPALVVFVICCVPLIDRLDKDSVSDYGFIAKSAPMALDVIGLLFVLTYTSTLVASELGSGTARTVLVRPIRRSEFLLAKLLFALSYLVALAIIASAVSWLLVYVFGDAAGVTVGGDIVYTSRDMALTYLAALGLSLIPLSAGVALALMISSLTRSTGSAVATTIGLWIAVDTVKYPLRISPFLFSSYIEAPWQVFVDRSDALDATWMPMTAYLLSTSVPVFVVCLAVAWYKLNRRNLCS